MDELKTSYFLDWLNGRLDDYLANTLSSLLHGRNILPCTVGFGIGHVSSQ